MCYNLN